MNTVQDVVMALGAKKMAAALGLSQSSIRMAVKARRFPAKWYLVVKALAEAKGLHVRDDLFAFDRVAA